MKELFKCTKIEIIDKFSLSAIVGFKMFLYCRKTSRKYKFHLIAPLPNIGQNLTSYKRLHYRLISSAVDIRTVYELLGNQPIQNQTQ